MKRILLKICRKIEDYEKNHRKQKNRNNSELLFVSFQEDGIYLNDVKIIDKKSFRQIEILKLFFLEQTKASLNNSKEIGFTWYELALKMELITKKTITEQYIRQSIHEIRIKVKSIHKNFKGNIIEINDHRYFLNEKINLNIHKKK